MASASELRSECLDRILDWEQAEAGSRREREAAEAFTRAFAELDACLTDGTSELPPEWDDAMERPTRPYQVPGRMARALGLVPLVLPRPQDRLLHVFVVDRRANERPSGS